MASYKELVFDWDILSEDSNKWSKQDLQLAAELGKTLLERNKELESALKRHQEIIDDQAHEIEYLQKQTAALKEVNDSRLQIYEQLDVGIQDLERANHRLIVESTADKKYIKSLQHNIEGLEAKSEELTRSLEDVKKLLEIEKRKNEKIQREENNFNDHQTAKFHNNLDSEYLEKSQNVENCILHKNSNDNYNQFQHSTSPWVSNKNTNTISTGMDLSTETLNMSSILNEESEEIIKIMTEMETTKKALISEQQRTGELEDQLVAIIQENQTLQSKIAHTSTNEEMKSVHEELSILEEVRQGTMCSRCLRSVEGKNIIEDDSSIIEHEDDDRSLIDLNPSDTNELFKAAVTIKVSTKPEILDIKTPTSNPYRDLVEKYEALLENQKRTSFKNTRQNVTISLKDELQASNNFNPKDIADNASDKIHNSTLTNGDDLNSNIFGCTINENTSTTTERQRKICRRTPTDFSEAETSSSGFSDETSNKSTQTDERQGYFLCSIGDGENCKFSIYDDASPIDSRFRNRPEYRELFKEIFAVLKKAAENKEEGETLPLLDDTQPVSNKVPPVTPANEELPDFGDDTQSIISSVISEQSVAMSECITKTERKTAKKHVEKVNDTTQTNPTTTIKTIIENGNVLIPLKREPLDYLSVSVGVRKKNRRKNRNLNLDRSESPIPSSPQKSLFSSGKKRRDFRPFVSPSNSNYGPNNNWNGNSMVIYNRSSKSSTPSPNLNNKTMREIDFSGVEYKPSTVSQDLHKLKNLELSYAEVLRRADACKHHHRRK